MAVTHYTLSDAAKNYIVEGTAAYDRLLKPFPAKMLANSVEKNAVDAKLKGSSLLSLLLLPLSLSLSLPLSLSLRCSYIGHQWFPAGVATNGLVKKGTATTAEGTDEIGPFTSITQRWVTSPATTIINTVLKSYSGQSSNVLVFETQVPAGAAGTNTSIPVVPGGWPGSTGKDAQPIVSFPSFITEPHSRSKLRSLMYVPYLSLR